MNQLNKHIENPLVLFEDEHILIVNKPNNILIHHSYYARNIKDQTLLERIKDELGIVCYPVHRLDRKTSGVLLLTKNKEDVSIFQGLFFRNEIQKKYIGIVRGHTPKEKIIDTPVKNPDTGKYKEALTFLETLQSTTFNIPVHPYSTSRYSLIRLTPKTGRMHQLRIHLNKISHPLVGDYKYGDRFHNRMYEQNFDAPILFLHAENLQFMHPFTKETINIQAPPPLVCKKVLNQV